MLGRIAAARGSLTRPWVYSRPAFGGLSRWYSKSSDDIANLRNIGISAHIDSGKTTLTERILFYTGRINQIHEVRGKDGVGAKMDSMDLEREKGITIQSAATYAEWKESRINIIDTPGHVDFTIEVERALRVLDGAILVLCAVGGVQSQSITVDRQMKRYDVPRLCFINKLDRMGANPDRIVQQVREKLRLNAILMQLPIGLEDKLEGVVDLVAMKAFYNEGSNGERIREADIPDNMKDEAAERRQALIECIADVDDEFGELFLMEEFSEQDIKDAVRRATIALSIAPVFVGSAFKNRGVQKLLDGVIDYLPCPTDVTNKALDQDNEEAEVAMLLDNKAPFVGLAFKLEEGKFGQLTYLRVYQGMMKRGMNIRNMANDKKIKVPRLVRMHSDEMEEVQEVGAGEIVAMFGVDCASGDTFTDGTVRYTMTSMHVPEPVMSLAIRPAKKDAGAAFSKALNRFQKEDPTFRSWLSPESGEQIIAGMGELHLEIYQQRMLREYNVETVVGAPQVSYRESITKKAPFNYLHKKQSGGQGQFGRVQGYIEPLPPGSPEPFVFENATFGGSIPHNFIPAVEKGFREACEKGSLAGHPVAGIKVVLEDGAYHDVDSSELAFKLASIYAFREAFGKAGGLILEPIMRVEVQAPSEFQGVVIGGLNKRKGMINNTETLEDDVVVTADVPLNNMFGYSTDIRSSTQGKGEFTMEYITHNPVPMDVQKQLMDEWQKARQEGTA